MSQVFPIEDAPRFLIIPATAGQTALSFNFPLQNEEDLQVRRIRAGVDAELTLDADFEVSIAAEGAGGTATLSTPALALDKYVLIGDAILARVLSVARLGKYNSAALDEDLDRLLLISQELRRDVRRGIAVPLGETGLTLPPVVERAGNVLGFEVDTGAPVAMPPNVAGVMATVAQHLAADPLEDRPATPKGVKAKVDEHRAEKGLPNGHASLDGSGKVPAAQLPSYVDDVLEFANLGSFPEVGETGKIYVALDADTTYRWSGSVYVPIGTVGDAAGKPFVFFIDGQSNARAMPAYAHDIPPNIWIFNWDGVDGTVGTALTRLADNPIASIGAGEACEHARRYPHQPTYIINMGYAGQPIAKWLSGASAPNMYQNVRNNVPAALTLISAHSGVTVDKIDKMSWFHGESDSDAANVAYIANFATMRTAYRALSWFPWETPITIYGISVSYGTGQAEYNKHLQAICSTDPEFLHYFHTSALNPALWAVDNRHLTAAGYLIAGRSGYSVTYGGAGRASIPFLTIDPYTGHVVHSMLAVAPVSSVFWLARKDQNGNTEYRLQNSDAGASAAAQLGVISNAGQLFMKVTSTAAGAVSSLETSVDGALQIKSNGDTAPIQFMNNASLRVSIGAGLQVGAASDPGSGWINAENGVKKAGTNYTNPDYVFEHEFTGRVEKFAKNPGASQYRGRLSLDELDGFIRKEWQLPGIDKATDTPEVCIFTMADRALEKIEELTLYILDLHQRIKYLENR